MSLYKSGHSFFIILRTLFHGEMRLYLFKIGFKCSGMDIGFELLQMIENK